MSLETNTVDHNLAVPMEVLKGMSVEELAEQELYEEKRRAMEPVPSNLDDYLNDAQTMSLRTMEYFGWRLAFVRRHRLEESIPVIFNLETLIYATLEVDGEVNETPGITIRH